MMESSLDTMILSSRVEIIVHTIQCYWILYVLSGSGRVEGWKGKGKVGFKGPVTLRCGACREVVTAVGVNSF